MSQIHQKLLAVQVALKAPKSNYNSFGKYSYRSCEDIMEAVKPLLKEQGLTMLVSDDVSQVGDRYYIRTTVTVLDTETGESVQASALAREEETKKGMDASQITGTASSHGPERHVRYRRHRERRHPSPSQRRKGFLHPMRQGNQGVCKERRYKGVTGGTGQKHGRPVCEMLPCHEWRKLKC